MQKDEVIDVDMSVCLSPLNVKCFVVEDTTSAPEPCCVLKSSEVASDSRIHLT